MHLRALRLLSLTFGLAFATVAFATVFDIPAQPVASALQLFGQQAKVEVVYPAAELRKVQSTAVKGDMTPAAAIELLLTNTGYAARQLSPTNFAVKKVDAPVTTGSVRGSLTGEGGKGLPDVLVSIRETAQSTETDRYGVFVFPNIAAGTYVLVASASGYQTMHITDVVVKVGRELTIGKEEMRKATEGPLALEPFVVHADTVEQLEKFTVEGARQKSFENGNVDIARTLDDPQAYYVFDNKTIEQSGATNVEDFLKQRLTMDASAQTVAQQTGSSNFFSGLGNASAINLRGLGTDATLVLIDGRRSAAVGGSNSLLALGPPGTLTTNQPDLNAIPLGAIDRIEVLPSSASGIYGGSALGGVINVILKKNYTGGEVRLTYDTPWDTDAPIRTASLSYGLGANDGKTHIMVNAQWSDAKSLILQDRAGLFQRGLAQVLKNSPASIYTAFSPFLGALPNLHAAFPDTPLVLKNGTSLGSDFTYVPAGTSSNTSAATLAAGLQANAGSYNFDLPQSYLSPTGLLRQLNAQPTTKSLGATVRQELWPALEASLDYSHSENNASAPIQVSGAPTVVFLQASNPISPFSNAFVGVTVPGLPAYTQKTNSSSDGLIVALTAKLPHAWTAEGDVSWSRSRTTNSYAMFDFTQYSTNLAAGLINPLVDNTVNPPTYLAKYFAPQFSVNISTLTDYALRSSGPLGGIPWGTPYLTVGLEHRVLDVPRTTATITYPFTASGNAVAVFFEKKQVANSGYAEISIPVVKEDLLPLVHSLELQLAGRSERFSVSAGTDASKTLTTTGVVSYNGPTRNGQPYVGSADYTSTNQTIGFSYRPVADVMIRFSAATAFLPPTPSQLVPNPLPDSFPSTVQDPKNNNASVQVQTVSGGNPNLKPQNSKSMNGGIVWEPSRGGLQGLRVDAEYYDIKQFDAISSLSAQSIVSSEANFPGRVTRDANGLITSVNTSLLNLYELETEGWDFSLGYRVKTGIGTFNLNAMESVILHLRTQYSLTLPKYDAVNFPSEGGAAKYKSNATLTWERGKWTVGWTGRYFGSYKQFGALGGPNASRALAQNPNAVLNTTDTKPQGGDTIPSQTYQDVFVGYSFGALPAEKKSRADFGSVMLANVTLEAGIKDVFNSKPPFDYFYPYYTSPYGDLRLRSFWVSLKKAF